MTIFSEKLHSTQGSLLVSAIVASTVAAILATAIIRSALVPVNTARLGSTESQIITTGHALAALLKQDLLVNYGYYTAKTNGWQGCTGVVSVSEFISILNNPPANCQSVSISWTGFKRKLGTTGLFASSSTLAELKSGELVPVLSVNGFDEEIKDVDFSTARNLLTGTVKIRSSGKSMPIVRSMQLVIDMQRTLVAPVGEACKICRAVAGATCCEASTAVAFTFLDSTGRIMSANFDRSAGTLLLSQIVSEGIEPKAVSVKNLETTRTDYFANSFCIPPIQASYVAYVFDAASQGGTDYFMTTDGNILTGAGTKLWATPDPKLVSLASTGTNWLLLRYDGVVLETADLTNPGSFTQINGLFVPLAEKITTGPGPVNTNCP